MMDRLPGLDSVLLCLDNDKAGHAASLRIAEMIGERGIAADRLIPENKDWNDDLVAEMTQRSEFRMEQGMG
jgi:DNA primase